MVLMRQVQDGAAAVWMDDALIMELEKLRAPPDVAEALETWESGVVYWGPASTGWTITRPSWLRRSLGLGGWEVGPRAPRRWSRWGCLHYCVTSAVWPCRGSGGQLLASVERTGVVGCLYLLGPRMPGGLTVGMLGLCLTSRAEGAHECTRWV